MSKIESKHLKSREWIIILTLLSLMVCMGIIANQKRSKIQGYIKIFKEDASKAPVGNKNKEPL